MCFRGSSCFLAEAFISGVFHLHKVFWDFMDITNEVLKLKPTSTNKNLYVKIAIEIKKQGNYWFVLFEICITMVV